MLTIGSIAGIIAWLVGWFVIRDIVNRMARLVQQIQAQGTPPTSEQAAELGALGARLHAVSQMNLVFLIIALLGMAIAEYVAF